MGIESEGSVIERSANRARLALAGALLAGVVGCAAPSEDRETSTRVTTEREGLRHMNEIAEAYVRLVLDVGQHDGDYVDAYYGPAEWRAEAEEQTRALEAIDSDAAGLEGRLANIDPDSFEERAQLRHRYLTVQIGSMRARIAMLGGRRFTFDEESEALYDAVAPTHDEAHFQAILDELDRLIPGTGDLSTRYATFQEAFVIPPDRLDAVFRAAIDECRKRTLERTELPADENFEIEYVKGKSWSAYNWYKGRSYSLIQVNEDLPIAIDRAIDLACHEGYPGHHVYNALLEKTLVRGLGWVEYSVYPLFSPQSLIAEGTANYGIDLAFPGDDRVEFERDVLFPLAGLDPSSADLFYRVWGLTKKLSYAGNEAARRYLNGTIDAEEAVAWLMRFALMPEGLAERRVRFYDQYRSYVINYNLGQDRVAEYIERKVGPEGTQADRWTAFLELLSSPRLPSGLLE